MTGEEADRIVFLQACGDAAREEHGEKGIGTLGEKTLHAVLKRYAEPNPDLREVPVGPYVADVLGAGGIVEIQTQGFGRLQDKLKYFLPDHEVTVVYPVPALKWVIWIEEGGTVSPRRKSPKKPGPWEVLPELFSIRSFLLHPNFHLRILMLEVEEYRLKNGWSSDGKRGSSRFDRLPLDLLGEVEVYGAKDYEKLVPKDLPHPFTAGEFAKKASLSPRKAWYALNVLQHVGVVERNGKRGRAYLYDLNPPLCECCI